MMVISLNKAQLKQLKSALNSADLDPKKKQRFLWRIAKRGVVPAVKRYVKNQSEVDGKKFSDRKSKRKKGMLNKIPKMIAIKDVHDGVKLYFKGRYKSTATKDISVSVLAAIHQQGVTTQQNKKQFKQLKDKDGKTQKQANKGEITKSQIKRLRGLEFTLPSGKKASKKWMESNLTRGRAGLIIQLLVKGIKLKHGEKLPKGMQSWAVKVPARIFFGISDEDFNKSVARELKNIGFGFDVKAQDIKKRGNK